MRVESDEGADRSSGGRVHPSMGRKIRVYRERRGLSVRKLAHETGISASLISRWERGLSTPTYPMAVRLAECFDVPVEWIWDHGIPPDVR